MSEKKKMTNKELIQQLESEVNSELTKIETTEKFLVLKNAIRESIEYLDRRLGEYSISEIEEIMRETVSRVEFGLPDAHKNVLADIVRGAQSIIETTVYSKQIEEGEYDRMCTALQIEYRDYLDYLFSTEIRIVEKLKNYKEGVAK